MKLFQIEEPDGAPLTADGAGAAVGMDIAAREGGAVAVAVGGNAELLPGDDGERRLAAPGLVRADRSLDGAVLAALLMTLRGRAERQLARPVTHAVIAIEPVEPATVEAAAAAAGLAVLCVIARAQAAKRAAGADAAVLGAALEAEDRALPAA